MVSVYALALVACLAQYNRICNFSSILIYDSFMFPVVVIRFSKLNDYLKQENNNNAHSLTSTNKIESWLGQPICRKRAKRNIVKI